MITTEEVKKDLKKARNGGVIQRLYGNRKTVLTYIKKKYYLITYQYDPGFGEYEVIKEKVSRDQAIFSLGG